MSHEIGPAVQTGMGAAMLASGNPMGAMMMAQGVSGGVQAAMPQKPQPWQMPQKPQGMPSMPQGMPPSMPGVPPSGPQAGGAMPPAQRALGGGPAGKPMDPAMLKLLMGAQSV